MSLLWLRTILGSKEQELSNELLLYEKELKDEQTLLDQQSFEIADLNKKVDLLSAAQVIEQPASLGTIGFQDVTNVLLQTTTLDKIFISDNNFQICSMPDAQAFSNKSKVWADKYVSEDHDCDNFSFALNGYWSEGLKSFAFGIAWSKSHAFNFFIDDKKQLWVVEPQTNAYYTLEEAKRRSSPDGLSYYPWRIAIC